MLLEAIASEGSNSADSADSPVARRYSSTGDDSIFSHLIERLIQARGLKLDDGQNGAASLEILLENCPDPVLLLTNDGEITEANPAFCTAYGYTQSDLIGQTIFAVIPERYRSGFTEKLERIAANGPDWKPGPDEIIAFRGTKADGAVVTMDCLLTPVFHEDRQQVIAVIRDLSTDKQLYEQLKESKDHYVALSETITEAIFRLDHNFTILFVNTGVKNTFGFDPEEIIGTGLHRLFPEEVFRKHAPEFQKYFVVDDQDRSAFGMKRTIELLGQTKYRGIAPMEMSFGNSKEFRGRTLTCIIRDITHRKMMERRLRHLAYHDKLTGLGNRDLFNNDIKAVLAEPSWTRDRRTAVLFLDLDGFKHVNDTFGHAAGDALLVEAARRIRVCLRDSDSPYRFGGDEFVALLSEVAELSDAQMVAERILQTIRAPYVMTDSSGGNTRVEVGVSIGVAVMPEHGKTAEEVTRCADVAMYFSKESGKNRVTTYNETLKTKSSQSWQVDQEMRSALLNGELQLNYQPLVGVDGHILGLEALLRWKKGGVDVMQPSGFIPIAEDNGMIIPLGAWVLHRALSDLKVLERRGLHDIHMAVNLSSRQFDHPDFIANLTDAIASAAVNPSHVMLEITETTLMSSPDEAIAKLVAIKKRYPELKIAIDDFGTGYSSLSYLSRLPADVLKIDISFVRALEREQNRKVVSAILNLAAALGILVVAEGIETVAQYKYFKERNCYAMQGFLFMKPVPMDALMTHLKKIHTEHRGKQLAAS